MSRHLIDAKQLAHLLSVSVRSIRRFTSAGQLPKPVWIQGCVRWDQDEIVRWIEAGCPDRAAWSKMPGMTTPGSACTCCCGQMAPDHASVSGCPEGDE